MVSTVSSPTSRAADIDAQIKKLAPTFQTAISATIDSESAPLKKIQAQKDDIDIRRGIFTDMRTNFDALQSAVQALISTQDSYGLNLTASSSVTPSLAGSTVFSATTTDSAVSGEYDIAVTDLAKAQTLTFASGLPNADISIGKSGTFFLGGDGATTKVTGFTAGTSLTNASASGLVATGQRELGSDSYSVEVRDYQGTRQFRLVNSDGTAVSIHSTNSASYTDAWQTLSEGELDTGRGLTLTLSKNGNTGSTGLTYTAKGTAIAVNSTDTLRSLAAAINAATQPDGHDFKAMIVANQLVFSSAQTGIHHGMLFSDGVGLGATSELQPAQNASFSVNGMAVSRAGNSALTDVIDGVTLNIAADAKGKSAHLSIVSNSDKAAAAMNTLVSKFNAAFTGLTQKMAITSSTSKTDSTKTTYTRGALTNDTVFSNLRGDMTSRMSRSYANSGSFKHLSDIGLSLDKNLKLTIDSAKFNAALRNNATDVTALLDTAMGSFNTVLNGYSGTSGALQKSINSIDDLKKTYDSRIGRYTDSLTMRKQNLYNTYMDMQTQLVEMNYQSNMLNIMLYGTSTTSSSTGTTTNTTG